LTGIVASTTIRRGRHGFWSIFDQSSRRPATPRPVESAGVEEPLDGDSEERPHRPPSLRPRRRKRRRGLRLAVRAAFVAVVFLIGLVIGRALQDAPKPGGSQTIVQTLRPTTVGPVETVVVTVTNP
jgi:hypothetical protein